MSEEWNKLPVASGRFSYRCVFRPEPGALLEEMLQPDAVRSSVPCCWVKLRWNIAWAGVTDLTAHCGPDPLESVLKYCIIIGP